MLETLREFALELPDASGEAARVQRRHAAYYLALVQAERPQPLTDRSVLERLDRLEVDLGNYRVALAWLLEQGDGEAALRLARALFPIWEEGGRLGEGSRWLARALAAGARAPAALRADGTRCLALLVSAQGDYAWAARRRRRCLRLYRVLGDAAGVAAVLMAEGAAARAQTDYAAARRHFEDSLTILAELGHVSERARCLAWLGAAARGQGQHAQARAYLEEGLAISRRLAAGQHPPRAAAEVAPFRCLRLSLWCLWNLGALACDEGDLEAARSHLSQLLSSNPAWDAYSLGAALLQVARVAAAAGQLEQAARLLAAADTQREASQHPWPPVDHLDRNPLLSSIRSSLPERALRAARRVGEAMTLEEARALAHANRGPEEGRPSGASRTPHGESAREGPSGRHRQNRSLIWYGGADGRIRDDGLLFTNESRPVPQRPPASRPIWRRLSPFPPRPRRSPRFPRCDGESSWGVDAGAGSHSPRSLDDERADSAHRRSQLGPPGAT
jgi:non-specific serine/threonine protein kinase